MRAEAETGGGAGFAVKVALVLVAGSTAMVASLGAPLVPAVVRQFDVSYADAQWNLTGPLLVGAVAMPIFGALGAGRTRRRAVMCGLALIIVGSILTTVSPSFGPFLAGRCLQGFGLALAPLAIAAARDRFEGLEQESLISILAVATVAGAGVAHPAASLMAAHWGLRGTFIVASAVNGLLLLITLLWFPRTHNRRGRPALDLLGVTLMGFGVAASLIGFTSAPRWGWASWPTAGLLVTGTVALAWWARRSLSGRSTTVNLRLALRRGLLGPNAVAFLAAFGVFAMVSLATLVVQDPDWGLGRSIALAGFLQLPYSITSVLGSRIALAAGRRVGTHWVLPIGCGVFALQGFGLAIWHDNLAAITICMAIGGLGGGFTLACIPILIVPHVAPEETAPMLAFNQVLRCVGSSAGSALAITLFVLLGGDGDALAATATIIGAVWVATGLLLAGGNSRLKSRRQRKRTEDVKLSPWVAGPGVVP